VSFPQPPTDSVSPAVAATAVPSIARPVTVPLPSVAWTLVAVTAPSNSETELRAIPAELHVEPLAVEEAKERTVPAGEYADGPRPEAGVSNATTACAGTTSAAAPAPTHPFGRNDCGTSVYDGAVVAAVVVASVLVVPEAAARAEPTKSAAATTAGTTSQTPRRIATV
jgi:hypothetical protein